MALYDSAWLLQRCKDIARRPFADETIDDTKWFRLLTEAEIYWREQLAVFIPEANLIRAELLTTADDGVTYTLEFEPVGEVIVKGSRTGGRLGTGPEWDEGTDYVLEGQAISFPGGRARTFSNGPYAWYNAAQRTEINAATQPTLKPARARVLLPYRACIIYAGEGGLKNPQHYQDLEDAIWYEGDPRRGRASLLDSLKVQYQAGYGGGSSQAWYHSGDLE